MYANSSGKEKWGAECISSCTAMKKVYVEAEVEIIEIVANDIITASDCQTGGGGSEELEII